MAQMRIGVVIGVGVEALGKCQILSQKIYNLYFNKQFKL